MGTSGGLGSDNAARLAIGFKENSIFQMLDESPYGLNVTNNTWRVYFGQGPTSIFVDYTRRHPLKFHFFDQFYQDVANNDLPIYTFLEPSYYIFFLFFCFFLFFQVFQFFHEYLFFQVNEKISKNKMYDIKIDNEEWYAHDQHPDHDVTKGEELIKKVYESLRSSKLWNDTLLIITYDEHGGFFDHVPPPLTVNPDGKVANDVNPPFNFDRLGIRVPTLFISPWIHKINS